MLGILTGGIDFKDMKFVLAQAQGDVPAVTLNYGLFIRFVTDCIIIVLCVSL